MTENYNEIRCPKCDASIFVYAEQAGQTIGCPRCQQEIKLPGSPSGNTASSTDADWLSLDDDILDTATSQEATATTDSGSVDEPRRVNANRQEPADDLQLAEDPLLSPGRTAPPESLTDGPATLPADFPAAGQDDDLGDLIGTPDTVPLEFVSDPFEIDAYANLEIEGVTPADGQFPVVCHLCGSLLYARVSQVGTQIKCHDCHSLVNVPPPTVEPTPVLSVEAEVDDDGGYRLSEPEDLQPIDTTFDITLGEIDYDDADFFEKRREREHEATTPDPDASDTTQSSNTTDFGSRENRGTAATGPRTGNRPSASGKRLPPEGDVEADYRMQPVTGKPQPKQRPPLHSVSTTTNISDPVSIEPTRPKREKRSQKTYPSKSPAAGQGMAGQPPADYPGLLDRLGVWAVRALKPLRDFQGLIRIGIATAIIGASYWLILLGFSYFGPEFNAMQKFGGFALVALGGVPLLITLFFLGVVANAMIGMAMEQSETLGDWPEFSLADWFSQFIYVGTSFWLAGFPGVIMGTLLALVTGNSFWLFSLLLISSLTLAPLVLSSVVFHESPAALISPEVFQAFGPLRNRWWRFLLAAFGISLLLIASIWILSLCVGGWGFLAFFVSAFQVALLFVYWWILGDHVGNVVRWMTASASP